MPPYPPRGRGLTAPEVLQPPTFIGLPPTSELIETPEIIIFAMDFLGDVRAFLAIQLTKNYRFDCGFVLKYYSN